MPDRSGVLRAIAHHEKPRAPMESLEVVELREGRGLEGDHRGRGDRPIAIVSEESWGAATKELGVDVPWLARRANLLVSGVDLTGPPGWRLEVGSCLLEVGGEVDPCALMDKMEPGLRKALEPEMRAGVWGRVVRGGTIRVGDPVRSLR